MEEREIEPQQPRETILVKRGLFYYLGQVIILPFKLLATFFSIVMSYLEIYVGWLKESKDIMKKRKKIGRSLDHAIDEEVI